MSVTTIEGFVENGVVRLPASIRLPERTKVYVVVPDMIAPQVAYVGSPRLAHPEQISDFEKVVILGSNDAKL